VEKARHKKPPNKLFHFYKMFTIGTFIETGSRRVIARDWGMKRWRAVV